MMVKKQNKTLRDIRKELREIYSQDNGSLPDMSSLSRKKSSPFRRKIIKAICILFVISLASWSGFLLFSNGVFQKGESLSVKIDGPKEVKSGDKITYAIQYENKGDVPIATLEMTLSLPPGFQLDNSVPEATSKNSWTIGSLTPKSDGVIIINGRFLSEVPSAERIQTLFSYKPANFSSTFQDIQTINVSVTDSILNLTATGPEKSSAGDELTYSVSISNTLPDSATNIRVFPNLPQDFVVSQTDPVFDKDKLYWTVNELKQNEPKTFTVKGSYTVSASGTQTMNMQVGFVKDDTFIKQKEQDVQTTMQGGSIAFHLIINGSDKSQNIQTGKTIRASIDFSNQGNDVAQDVSFNLSLDGNGKTLPIDWNKSDFGGGKRNGNSIVWNNNTNGMLKNIKPEDSGTIDISLPVLSSPNGSNSDTITAKLITSIDKVGSNSDPKSIESTPIVLTFDSNTSFSSESRYFMDDGQPVGSGPLPPKVGQTTTYRIYFHISNSLHELKGIEVLTSLPTNINWTDKKQSAIGNVSYNPTTRTVKWTSDKIPSSLTQADAWFDVSLKPTITDVGKFVKLTGTINFSATDSKTSGTVTNSVESLTTESSGDDFAKGKGTVTK